MGFWRRQQRSIRKRVVRLVHGDKPFIADYLGADFHVRLDNIMGREIAYRSFERDRIENFMALCKAMKPDLFLDIGANCGVYACILLKADLAPRAVLFEPDRENAAALRDNIKLNDLAARTEVHEAAAGAKAARATFIPGPAENKGQSSYWRRRWRLRGQYRRAGRGRAGERADAGGHSMSKASSARCSPA